MKRNERRLHGHEEQEPRCGRGIGRRGRQEPLNGEAPQRYARCAQVADDEAAQPRVMSCGQIL